MNLQTEVSTKPEFSTAAAETIAAQHFQLDGTARELPGERDQNFLIQTRGAKFVLKIANPVIDPKRLEFENAAIGLVGALGSVESPELVRSVAGSNLVPVQSPSGTVSQVRCLTHVPGIPLAKFQPHPSELLACLGRILADIDNELTALNHHPAARHGHWWNLDQADQLVRQSLPRFKSKPDQFRLLELVLSRHESIKSRLNGMQRSVIHNDANDYNILVNHDPVSDLALLGLIDFGDLCYSTTINDLAICCAYAILGKSSPLEAIEAVTSGYHQSRRLNETELSSLFPLIGLRLAHSVTNALIQRELQPENEYLSISEQPAWQALERWSEIDPDEVRDRLSEACSAASAANLARRGLDDQQLRRLRSRFLGPSLSLAYEKPIHVVRGKGQYLFDADDVTYLDCVNNVCHVGHAHPHVVRAAAEQMELLNTNTRYLHEHVVLLARRLTSTMPPPLEVCFFVNSGSEANDLALRLAQVTTGSDRVAVLDHAYHGHTRSLIDISPYKFNSPGGAGQPDHVCVFACPDGFRGKYRYDDAEYGNRYVGDAAEQIMRINASGQKVGAFFAESLMGCGGQIVLPPGYLKAMFGLIRNQGGICISDEVQVGFGRVGTDFWGFQQHDVVPDVVTLGKPFGNGHPLAAVVTTRAIAEAFDNGMEYFNTFGGNPVSCAVGLAVLDVIEREQLQRHALETGNYLMQQWRDMQPKFDEIGDVRGSGLFLGIELVQDRSSREPATGLAKQLVEKLKHRRILLSTDGPDANVIKVKPPMVFGRADAERLLMVFEQEISALLG